MAPAQTESRDSVCAHIGPASILHTAAWEPQCQQFFDKPGPDHHASQFPRYNTAMPGSHRAAARTEGALTTRLHTPINTNSRSALVPVMAMANGVVSSPTPHSTLMALNAICQLLLVARSCRGQAQTQLLRPVSMPACCCCRVLAVLRLGGCCTTCPGALPACVARLLHTTDCHTARHEC